jgi:Predicted hydrolases or acyltransferases (alpha/beta hydrolase superfamily)
MREGKYISVDGIRTHYFEAGESHRGKKPSVLLLHSAEYGGAAEFSWEFNLPELGKHYHVLAPDHLGFGLTDKIFDFNGQFDRRITHIRRFIEAMGVGPVHVMGSSMSGGLTMTVAARKTPDWPMLSLVCCSGGGDAPNNDQRKVINTYDGSREHMRRIIQVMFIDPKWSSDEAYLDRRWEMALVPGAWEAPPPRVSRRRSARRAASASATISIMRRSGCRRWCMAGKLDCLREPGYTDAFVPKIPKASQHIFDKAGHMGNIECAAEFNERVLAFLDAQKAVAA